MPPDFDDRPLRFGRFQIDPAQRLLSIDGQPAAIGARAFDLLLVLARQRARLVTKQELLDLVWPGVVVEEHNIAAQISSLRKLLGPQVIATVPGQGYRFVAAPDAAAREAAVAAQRPAPGEVAAAAPPAPAPPRHRLPEQRTRFIGREAALADLLRLLRQARLVTLTGIGGSGKTRLALQCAQRIAADFDDGVCFVDLAPLHEPDRVAPACAAALGIVAGAEPPLAEQIAAHLESRRVLIVLDNCEQVRAGAAALADAVLARPGASRVLATSREALAVAGEQLYPVPPLSLPASPALADALAAESVQVFVDRVRQAWPQFELDDANVAAVAEICRRLDGIALAIELAAARVPMLSPADVAARLHDRFRLLNAGHAGVSRQTGLRATMQWSYDLLPPAGQRAWRRLGVFVGGCTLEGASAVLGAADEYETLTLLTLLHDRSLLLVDRGHEGRPRYRMLETVHEYARQRLDDGGEGADARTRHAAYLLELAESAAPHLRGTEQSQWMKRLAEEQENLVAALAWCSQPQSPVDPQWGMRIAAATARYWLFVDVELGLRLSRAALQRDPNAADSAAHAEALLGLAAMCMHSGRADDGLPPARAALAMAQRIASVELQARAFIATGACLRPEDQQLALQCYEQGRDLARDGGSASALGAALNNIANIDFEQGRLDGAMHGYRESLHLSRARGDLRSALIVLHNLMRVLVAARRHDEARESALEALRMLNGVSEDVLKLELIEVSAGLASSRGDHEIAARLWGFATRRFTDAGYRRPPVDERQLVQLSAETRRALGDAAFDAAEAAGRALDLDAAMRELRRMLGDA